MLDAIAAGVALAFVVVVWAMSPSKGDSGAKGKRVPLGQQGTHKGGA